MRNLIVATGAALALLSSVSFAQPGPGNPNCFTNWVGGACGLIANNGNSNPKAEPEPRLPVKKECEEHEPKKA